MRLQSKALFILEAHLSLRVVAKGPYIMTAKDALTLQQRLKQHPNISDVGKRKI